MKMTSADLLTDGFSCPAFFLCLFLLVIMFFCFDSFSFFSFPAEGGVRGGGLGYTQPRGDRTGGGISGSNNHILALFFLILFSVFCEISPSVVPFLKGNLYCVFVFVFSSYILSYKYDCSQLLLFLVFPSSQYDWTGIAVSLTGGPPCLIPAVFPQKPQ